MKRHHSRTWYAAIACAIFVIGTHMSDLMRLAGSRRFIHGWISLGVANLLQVILCVSGIIIAHATGVRRAIGELGLRAPIGRAAIFAFIAALPMLLAFALSLPLNPKMSVLSVGVGCVLAPFAEEVLFRGYMFGQLYRRARWGFWLSALIPSVLFRAWSCLSSQWSFGTRRHLRGDRLGQHIGMLVVYALAMQSLGCFRFALFNESLVGSVRRR